MKPNNTYQTKVITDETHVPEGYIAMTELTARYTDSQRKQISRAQCEGRIRAVKLMRTTRDIRGAVYVFQDDAAALMDSMYGGARDTAPAPDAMSNSSALMLEALIRIASTQEELLRVLIRIERLWTND